MTTWYQSWLRYIWRKKWIYLLGILTLTMTDYMQVQMMQLLGIIIDFFSNKPIPSYIVQADRYSTFLFIFFLFVLNRILMCLGRVGWRLCLASQSQIARGELRTAIWDRAVYYPMKSFHFPFSKGTLMNLSTSDNTSAIHIYGFTLVGIFDSIILGFFCIHAMWVISPQLTAIILLTVSPLPFLIKRTADQEGKLHDIAQKSMTELNDAASQSVGTVRLQRLTQTGGFWEKLLEQFALKYRDKRFQAMHYSLLFGPLFMLCNTFASIVLFVVGIRMTLQGELTVGQFVIFQGVIATLQGPLMQAGAVVTEWKEGSISLKRITEAVNHHVDAFLFAPGLAVNHASQVFSVNNLYFKHVDSDRPVFDNFNLQVANGERLGITGAIGTGKTTLLEILAGVNRQYQGSVEFMGQNIANYSHEALRKEIFMVSQKPFLFAESVRSNLCLDLEKTDAEIWQALDVAGIKEDIEHLKDGLDTELGEWGINLSGGQKQRMTLARVLLRKPKVLLIDDALSAVDTVTEDKIIKHLDRELKETTIVWVAHRKSTLKYCHRIIQLGE